MYKRIHHQQLVVILDAMNPDFLREAKCYFGGGTAIALQLGEYRESVDIDFLCADQDGYRKLRESIFDHGLSELFVKKIDTIRDIRADQDGIRTVFTVDGTPVKFKIVREARIGLSGVPVPNIAVPCLSKSDLFAEKLLANADRFNDKSVMSRDVIDLLVMEHHWGPIPDAAWNKASNAYGNTVRVALQKSKQLLIDNPKYLNACLIAMGIDDSTGSTIRAALGMDGDDPSGLSW